jgi:hypothetical protein
MSRQALYHLLAADVRLDDFTIYGSIAVETPPDTKPFIVMHFQNETKAFAGVGTQLLDVWVYDHDRDYARIDGAQSTVREIYASAVHIVGGDGSVLTQVDWQGSSGDLWSDDWNAATRYDTFQYTSRPE